MFLNEDQLNNLRELGMKIGQNVLISDKAVFYTHDIQIGDNCRIDDFTIISAPIELMKYVHIGCHCAILGKEILFMASYSGLSGRCSVYTSSDNYDGEYMTNPCIPEEIDGIRLRNTDHRSVFIGSHTVVGTGSTILKRSMLDNGCAVYAHSLVNGDFPKLSIIAGVPAKVIGQRKDNIFKLEALWKQKG